MAAFFDLACERGERFLGVGGVMKHAYTEGVIKGAFERELKDVALDDVCIRAFAGEGKRGFDPVAEVNADDLFGSPLGSELCVASLAAAALKHDLAFEKLGRDGLKPTEKLFVIFRVLLREVGPLPAEVFGGLSLVGLYLAEIGKARNPADHLIFAVALFTGENPVNDLFTFVLTCVSEKDIAAAGGAGEEV